MVSGVCSGAELPDGARVACTEQVNHLSDCCVIVDIGDDVLLHECVSSSRGEYYYWLFLWADECPLAVCALEQYAEHRGLRGRRAEYLAMGWYVGTCYAIAMELRHNLLTENHFEDKLEQVKQCIDWVTSELLQEFSTSDFFGQACDAPDQYRVAGAIIPVDYSKKRAEQSRLVSVNGYTAAIAAVPHSFIRECRISWCEMLTAMGIADATENA